MNPFVRRYHTVRSEIDAAASAAGRRPEDVVLVAVSKTAPASSILALAEMGGVTVGESRVQEAEAKVREMGCDPRVRWHFVGRLQSKKAAKVVRLFQAVHSVDSVNLLEKLESAAEREGRTIRALLEVNLAGEETKGGCRPGDVGRLLEVAARLKHVRVTGFMTIPPYSEAPEDSRPYFRRLREIRDEAARGWRGAEPLAELSMGMSHDFAVAVSEGATLVRVGTAIFGERETPVRGGQGGGARP